MKFRTIKDYDNEIYYVRNLIKNCANTFKAKDSCKYLKRLQNERMQLVRILKGV